MKKNTTNSILIFLLLFGINFSFGQDTDSDVDGSNLLGQPNPITISSLVDTNIEAVRVFDFDIYDYGTSDGLNTDITQITIKSGTNNNADWSAMLQGVKISKDGGLNFVTIGTPTITTNTITIPITSGNLVITDGSLETISLFIYLNNSGIIEDKILEFKVDGNNHGFTTATTGSSQFATVFTGTTPSPVSNQIIIDVEATELQFKQQPTTVEENIVMTPAVTVTYTDVNGNIDLDDGLGVTATLTTLGGVPLAATTTTNGTPINGEITFSDIEFTGAATGITLVVTDNAGITTPNVTSIPFDVTATPIACSELFISEYIEGNSNNKYLEIFNPTTTSIDLTDYQIVIYSNFNTTPTATISFTTGAFISSNDVYIIAHSSANIWTGTPNQTTGSLNFNGDDAVALRKLGTDIDVIGIIGSGTVFAEDTTLIRKKSIAFPNTNYNSSEWNTFISNTVTDLGTHLSNCPCTGVTSYTTASGWSNGDPNETTKAHFINSYNTGIANINACRCEIDNGATLTIDSGSYIKVQDSITNNGVIHVLNQGSVVQVYDDAIVSGTGTFNTDITTTNLVDGDRFTYFSSPVESATLNSFNAWADMGYLWNFVGATQDWSHITDVNTVMIPATGYIVQPISTTTNATPTTTFIGPFNNGVFTHAMYFEVPNSPDATDASSALVGNPYPSAINSNLLFQKNAQLGGIYIWNHDSAIGGGATSYGDWVNNDYIVCASNLNCTNAASSGPNATHSGYIASGQGFFATANAASPADLVFDNSMRVVANNTDFRRPTNSNTEKLWLNLTSTIGYFNQSLFVFTENGTPNYNNQADAKRLGSNYGISIYSLTDTDDRLAVDNRGIFQNDITIPLGYYLNNDNVTNLTFSIDHFENLEDTNVYLKDNLLNTIHDLKIADYVFNTSTGIFNTRFELLFSRTALSIKDTNLNNSDNLIITNVNNTKFEVKMLNNSKIINFKAYDVLGKLIVETNPNLTNFEINTTANKGTIIFVKVSLENGQTLTKKFLKN